MPSIQAWFWYYALSVITYRSRRLTIEEELDKIAKHQAQANAPQQLPAACRSDPNVTTEESTFIDSNSGNQWQMFEFSPTVQKARKVILHFHGGGWVGESHELEYMVAFRYAQRLGARVIFPNWTLAPQTCASEFAIAAVELFLSIAEDTQYENMDICLSGMSAGGWCALRTLLAACEAACESDLERRKRLTIALDRVSNVILFCPAVDLVMDQEAERLSQYDPMLKSTSISMMGNLWWFGPNKYPQNFKDLPESLKVRSQKWTDATRGTDLAHPHISLVNGLDAIERYVKTTGRTEPFAITSFAASYEVLYPGIQKLHRKLSALGANVVVSDLNIAPKQGHCYMILPMPETEVVWRRIAELIQ